MGTIITTLLALVWTHSFAQEEMGLLIIAHGSPQKEWNQPVLDIEEQVKESLETKKHTEFKEVRVALMEFSEPSIANTVRDMENNGITKIFVLPLFIAPSEHSLFDLPTILGLHYDEARVKKLEEEGIKIIKTNINITIGPSLNYGNVIKDILLKKVQALSKNPKDEALVILAHGDRSYIPIWEDLISTTGNYILGETGLEYFDKAFVEMGQSFSTNGIEFILKANKNKKRVIVIGMYLSMGVKNMAEKSGIIMMGRTMEAEKMLEGKNIVFDDSGLLPDKKIAEWIVDRSLEWLNSSF